jgi:propanediol dehydratase small subunit
MTSTDKLTTADYPLAEKRPELVVSQRGLALDAITLDAVASGAITMDEIARDAGRATLAQNFERAAELTAVPQDVIMRTYELLRPGRAASKQVLIDAAETLRSSYQAHSMAAFVAEAADVYERRGLFKKRY